MNRRNNEQSAGRLTARSTARPDTEFQYRSQRPDHPPARGRPRSTAAAPQLDV